MPQGTAPALRTPWPPAPARRTSSSDAAPTISLRNQTPLRSAARRVLWHL